MSEAIQETMKTVMKAQDIVGQFHRNVAELFRTVTAEFEAADETFVPVLEEGELLTSSLESSLRGAGSWVAKHLAQAYCSDEEDGGPIFLVHVSTDASFSDVPELWLGVLSGIESEEGEEFPWEESVAYIFEDYFGPEDSWTEAGKWYDVSFSDEQVSAGIGFCRQPLSALTDRSAIRKEIVERLLEYASGL
jgi:hypothetical protein